MSKRNHPRKAVDARGGNGVSATSLARGWLPVVAGLVVVVGAGLWFGGLIPRGGGGGDGNAASASSSSSSTSWDQSLPSFITSAPTEVQEAYAFVAAHPTETQYMPCYCGCGEHSGHRWLRDCFVKDWSQNGITYDPHGSGCDVCVNIALDVKSGLVKGESLMTIRKAIDAKYSDLGPPTDTPLPPA